MTSREDATIYLVPQYPGGPVLVGTADRIALARSSRFQPGVGSIGGGVGGGIEWLDRRSTIRTERQDLGLAALVRELDGGPGVAEAFHARFAHLNVAAIPAARPAADPHPIPALARELVRARDLFHRVLYLPGEDLLAWIAAETRGWSGEHGKELGVARPKPRQVDPPVPVASAAADRSPGDPLPMPQ